MKTAILFILMLLVLVIPHELGHMIVAKLCGVKVNEFSVGMGPCIFKRKKGETQYSVRIFPLGGYCAMEGEDGESDNPRAFNNKTSLQKFYILIAGVTMNIIIAIVGLSIAIGIGGIPTNKIDEVMPGSPAYIAGLESGDEIIEISGNKVNSWEDVKKYINEADVNKKIEITAKRKDGTVTMSMNPEYDKETKSNKIGITATLSRSPAKCIAYGSKTTWEMTKLIFEAFQKMVTGNFNKDDVAGPIGMVKVVDQTSNYGGRAYLMLLALVSINLAIFNLIPIPGLDGGKIFFIFLKIISGGRINDDMEYKATMVGMVVLISLFVLVTINDLINLF